VANSDLIRMVNQSARFFEPYPEDEAIACVAEHLQKFWDPSMRSALIAVTADDPSALHPLAVLAVQRLPDTRA